jgi:hypothetical protein
MGAVQGHLTDDDLRYEFRVMRRWCRLYQRTALDWVRLEAERFRQRHPVEQHAGRRPDRAA